MCKTNVKVSLRIMGEEHNFINEITNSLKLNPTESWMKGEAIHNSRKKRKYTAWIYSTCAVETLDVNLQAQKLEKLFSTKIENICALKNKYDLDISIDFVIIIENQEIPAIYFEASFIEFAAKIGARFDIDTYIN